MEKLNFTKSRFKNGSQKRLMEKEIGFDFKGEKINLKVKVCNSFEKFIGLMFSRREKAKALLLFDFKKPHRMKIHSLFVFFLFFAVWLDDRNKVMELKLVKPWKFLVLPKKPFFKLIEIPINHRYKNILEFPRR